VLRSAARLIRSLSFSQDIGREHLSRLLSCSLEDGLDRSLGAANDLGDLSAAAAPH
jgi:hypothetical protein